MIVATLMRLAAGAHGIRRGCSLANSAGTYEFAREHPATSCAPVVAHVWRAIKRMATCERARKFRRRERAWSPDSAIARQKPCNDRGLA